MDEVVSEATPLPQRLSIPEPTRSRPGATPSAPTLGEVDPWITVYVGIVEAIMEREQRGRGERSPAA